MRAMKMILLAGAALMGIGAASPPPAMDTAAIATQRFGNDAPWYRDRIPFFESADPTIDAVYYYRWQVYRGHQRDLGAEGYITTEFFDDVDWQRHPYASLNDASGFHIGEGRWLNDRRFADDYINFMYGSGGNDRHFTDHMADSVWGRYLVDGDRADALKHLPVMNHIYRLWDDKYDFDKGLYFVEPLLDATEYTVSSIDASGGKDGFRGGDAFRPSVNSYMFANARALSKMAEMAGNKAMAATYAARADALQKRVLTDLWSDRLSHFIDRHQSKTDFVKYWDPIRNRELVGYLPWMFDLVPDDAKYAAAWAHLLDPASLAGKAGMRTVEANYEYYMRQYRYLGDAPECQWNGPIWPYQTTQVLHAMANLLDHYKADGPVTRSAYMRLLRQYATLHYQGSGKDRRLDIEEDYHPETGKPIVGLDRSHHYFHSGFNDLILTGLVGIRPRADDVLEVNPLLPDARDSQALAWFRVQDVPYHGHKVAVTWDADGSHYQRGKGLSIEVDGREVARRDTLGRVEVPVARVATPPIARPINRAVQLVRGQFPMGSASSNSEPENVHDAIDGRVWFFPELPNGWSSAPTKTASQQYYAIDLGKPVDLGRAELAFFADGKGFAVPQDYRLQAWVDGDWRDIATPKGSPVANGVTDIHWTKRPISKLRLLFTQPAGKATRLAEIKLFEG